ncbi:hypothetical protein EIN_080230 [Entamoeba invadens IP1]|uniref:hypothetical protein n=1 Tax=Entamoeba invadens IP1 TaxID=370355 RepID=UPI0002C3DE75|nr:hypothetical protein EIN_080230 [Entamoeba invadens IP1]ELP85071.1 hypothetical protein EIN_080230 [Entamoeba invadens IP1]|eukprot:XP_004184417.1 hypothetical protein EIN_080230 [Entamoeba invadens IP1]
MAMQRTIGAPYSSPPHKKIVNNSAPITPRKSTDQNNLDNIKRLVLIGDEGVGKSALISGVVHQKDYSNALNGITANIGGNFPVQLMEKSTNNAWSNYLGGQCVIVMYDITDHTTFENAKGLLKDAKHYSPDTSFMCIVGNKTDLFAIRKVPIDEVLDFVNKVGCSYFEISCRNQTDINEMFNTLVQKIVEQGKESTEKHIKPRKKSKTCTIL